MYQQEIDLKRALLGFAEVYQHHVHPHSKPLCLIGGLHLLHHPNKYDIRLYYDTYKIINV